MVDSLSGRAEAAAVLRRIEHMGTKGVVSPLSGEVAALMVVGTARHGDDCETGPFTHRVLNSRGMTIINGATWGEHVGMPKFGLYRGNWEAGYFDWAVLRAFYDSADPRTFNLCSHSASSGHWEHRRDIRLIGGSL
jgi:hypothetical protein